MSFFDNAGVGNAVVLIVRRKRPFFRLHQLLSRALSEVRAEEPALYRVARRPRNGR